MRQLSKKTSYFVMVVVLAVLAAHNYFGTVNQYDTGIPTLRSLQHVVNLPNAASFRLANGDWIDLGYKHNLLAGGAWVKTVQSQHTWNLARPRQYFDLSESQLTSFIEIAGLVKLPNIPRRPVIVLIIDWGILMIIAGMLINLLSTLAGFGPAKRSKIEGEEFNSFRTSTSTNTVSIQLPPASGPIRFGKR